VAKTTVNTFLDEVQLEADYSITDTDLDTLTLSLLNKAIKRVKNLLKDNGVTEDITAESTFITVEDQEYRDITKAIIVGDTASFTGIANDKLKVSVDGTDYDNIDISGDASIADVVSSINTAVGSTVASETTDGYLQIGSLTTGSSSAVTVADGGTTGQTVVGDLFSASARRSSSGIVDLDQIIQLSERTNDRVIPLEPWDRFRENMVDPSVYTQSTPDGASRVNNRIYFRGRPTQSILIYIEYYKLIADVAAGGNMPFEDKYDVLIAAMVKLDLQRFLDSTNTTAIADWKDEIKNLIDELIVNTSREFTRQAASRREEVPYIQPRAAE
jgi:hypothetical protein